MVSLYVEYLIANCITCIAKVIDYNNSKLWWRSIFRLGAWKRASFSKSSNPSLRRAVLRCTSSRDALLTRELSAQWYKLAQNSSRRVISCPLSSIMRIDLDWKQEQNGMHFNHERCKEFNPRIQTCELVTVHCWPWASAVTLHWQLWPEIYRTFRQGKFIACRECAQLWARAFCNSKPLNIRTFHQNKQGINEYRGTWFACVDNNY